MDRIGIRIEFLQNIIQYLQSTHSDISNMGYNTFNMDRVEHLQHIGQQIHIVIEALQNILINVDSYRIRA